METKNSSIEESSQEDSDILANAKGYFNKYFNMIVYVIIFSVISLKLISFL